MLYCNVLFQVIRNEKGNVSDYYIENYHICDSRMEIADFTQRLGVEYLLHTLTFTTETEALHWLSQFKSNCPCTPKWVLDNVAL